MIGKIFEGRWKITERKLISNPKSYHYRYLLVNIYNEQRMWITDRQLTSLNKGTLTLSKIRMQRLLK